MDRKTATMAAAAPQPSFVADSSGRSKRDWMRAHDRAIGALIGIAFTGAMWATWAMVATNS